MQAGTWPDGFTAPTEGNERPEPFLALHTSSGVVGRRAQVYRVWAACIDMTLKACLK